MNTTTIKAYGPLKHLYADRADGKLKATITLAEGVSKEGKIISSGSPYELLISKELFKELESTQATRVYKKNFLFNVVEGVATSVSLIDNAENLSKKQLRTATEAAEIEIGIMKNGERRVLGIPADYDLSIADSIRSKLPQNLEDLKVKDKINNHALLRVIDEGEVKKYIFKAIP